MHAIAPSILSADFARLGEEVLLAEKGGANRIHVDVMDGHFVSNLSMGPIVVKALRPVTKLPLEVHLMVDNPSLFVEPFLACGADSLIVHYEVLADAMPLLREVKAHGKKVGMAVNPGTPVEVLEAYLDELDVALCMTVWPGYGGQAFLPESPARIEKLRKLIDRRNLKCEIEVDGGIDKRTIGTAAKCGANVFVAGTAVFAAKEGADSAVKELQRLAGE